MFRRFFAIHESASPSVKAAAPAPRRLRRSQPALEGLEGRQLLSVSPQLLVDPPSLNVATFDTVRKTGSGTTSGGGVYLRYSIATVYTTSHS
jgi:hypothetical protein